MPDTFVCAQCKERFAMADDADDALAREELERTFPGTSVEECTVVCDSCYDAILKMIEGKKHV